MSTFQGSIIQSFASLCLNATTPEQQKHWACCQPHHYSPPQYKFLSPPHFGETEDFDPKNRIPAKIECSPALWTAIEKPKCGKLIVPEYKWKGPERVVVKVCGHGVCADCVVESVEGEKKENDEEEL